MYLDVRLRGMNAVELYPWLWKSQAYIVARPGRQKPRRKNKAIERVVKACLEIV